MADLDLEDGVDTLEHHDGFANARNMLRRIAVGLDLWCGIPMPLEDQRLVIEPTYPRAEALAGIYEKVNPKTTEDHGHKVRNIFWSWRWRCDIAVIEDKDGKVWHGKLPRVHSLGHALSTLGASDVWGIEQEAKAVKTLGGLVKHRQFKQYMLTGMFVESSKRSGVHYIFRRLRPTVAFRTDGRSWSFRDGTKHDDESRILCALCLHPIAYYEASWAGAMCPTDDVIAHLMLMRGDEPMFWRRANQHASWRPEAGL